MKKKITLLLSIAVAIFAFAKAPFITKVYEYLPAPGQFVNTLPPVNAGDTHRDVIKSVEKRIVGYYDEKTGNPVTSPGMICLGAYGGYVIFGFDHPVVNVIGSTDFKVYGNAFDGNSEPGIVMVGVDTDGDGVPSDGDKWYELAGSEYFNDDVQKNYTITYFKPEDELHSDYPWESNGDEVGTEPAGVVPRNGFHKQEYWPLWIEDTELTFTGTNLWDNSYYNKNIWTAPSFEYGYADNTAGGDEFDISSAVNADGEFVELPYIDFVKVYTGINRVGGNGVGETSTEVCGAEDLHPDVEGPLRFNNGFFILNEGWYGHDSGVLNYYDYDEQTIMPLVYRAANEEMPLGVTSQYAQIFDDKIFICSKQHFLDDFDDVGGRFIVANAHTLEQIVSIKEIGQDADTRAFIGINKHKGYISTSNGIYIFDIDNMQVGKMIEKTEGDGSGYNGQTGDMVRYGKYVFAAWQDTGILVINTETDEVEDLIDLPEISTVWLSTTGRLFAALNTCYWGVPSDNDTEVIIEIDPESFKTIDVFKTKIAPQNTWGAWQHTAPVNDPDEDVIYYIPTQQDPDESVVVARYDLNKGEYTHDFITFEKGQLAYGNVINYIPKLDQLAVVTYAGNLKQKYWLNFYSRKGELMNVVPFDDNYWFTSQLVLQDNDAPEIILPSITITVDESASARRRAPQATEIKFEDIVADDDTPANLINVTAVSSDNNVVEVENNARSISLYPNGSGDATITFTAESNGKTVSKDVKAAVTVITAVEDITAERVIKSVKYVNLAGHESMRPWSGVNIIVTTFTDGSTSTQKKVF